MTSSQSSPAPTGGPAFRPGQISILIATRGRPEMLAQVFEAFRANTTRKDQAALWLYVDDDDEVMRRVLAEGSLPDPGLPVHWHIGPRPGGLGETHQVLWAASGGTSQIYVTTVDDARFVTPGWDDLVRAAFDPYPDGLLLAFPHDPMTADQATYPFLGGPWIRTLGRLYPGYFPYWFDDKWVDQVGRMAGRCVKLPIALEPIGGKGRTKRMRNMPFWTRFFQLTLGERKDSARKLLTAIHGANTPALAAALVQMEQTAQTFAQEQADFSDAYCVFQEERHTEMSPEERNRFDPKSFRPEALACSRLIVLAQDAIAAGHFAEAMTFLDATQYSDLRVRYAQLLKADCLAALGQNADAGRLRQETLAVWPQMNPLRRAFRFLGMVVNDGKRLFVGLTEKKKIPPGK